MQTTNLRTDDVLTAIETGNLIATLRADARSRGLDPVAVILRGISGAGKTTFIDRHLSTSRTKVFSADHFFEGPSGYDFDPAKLPRAHQWCFRCWMQATQFATEPDILVCDNTNTSVAELAPYAMAAQSEGLAVYILELHRDPKDAHAANQHQVPLGAIYRQLKRMKRSESYIPPWWPVFKIPFREI